MYVCMHAVLKLGGSGPISQGHSFSSHSHLTHRTHVWRSRWESATSTRWWSPIPAIHTCGRRCPPPDAAAGPYTALSARECEPLGCTYRWISALRQNIIVIVVTFKITYIRIYVHIYIYILGSAQAICMYVYVCTFCCYIYPKYIYCTYYELQCKTTYMDTTYTLKEFAYLAYRLVHLYLLNGQRSTPPWCVKHHIHTFLRPWYLLIHIRKYTTYILYTYIY